MQIDTECGTINMKLRSDWAPETVKYISDLVRSGAYNGKTFYRSDFVIQMGLHPEKCPKPNLTVNETSIPPHISNTRGTASVAHWDVPDCGNSEFFINLQANAHLDTAYGGYCVFAQTVGENDLAVVDKIAATVKQQGKVVIMSVKLV
jgi:cyclophilin family peptidyl-prolyl cis-trans isomerase